MIKPTTYESNPQILQNNHDFESERELKEYILLNKELFCREVLGFEYKHHFEEFALPKCEFTNEPRVDLVFVSQDDNFYYVELKNPQNAYRDLCSGLSQCLAYRYLAKYNNLKYNGVYLVTTQHSQIIPLIIKDNNLDIKYIYFDRSKHAVF